MATKPVRPRVKQVSTPAPQTLAEASHAIARIGQLQRERARIEMRLNDEVAKAKERAEEQALPLAKEIETLTDGVIAWAEAHRQEICPRDSKTAQLPAGEISWRITPPKCVIRSPELVIETLKRLGLQRLIRTKEEPNREAILAEPEAVRGVGGITISQREEVIITPYEVELAPT